MDCKHRFIWYGYETPRDECAYCDMTRKEAETEQFLEGLRKLVRDKEWVTDGREGVTYCLWCFNSWHKGHTDTCEMFGRFGFVAPAPRDAEKNERMDAFVKRSLP